MHKEGKESVEGDLFMMQEADLEQGGLAFGYVAFHWWSDAIHGRDRVLGG